MAKSAAALFRRRNFNDLQGGTPMPNGYYYGFDYTWYLLVLPAFLLALWAQFRVQ